MCEPATIATLVITAVSAVASYSQAQKQAEKQEQAVRDGYTVQMEGVTQQYEQNADRASSEMSQRAREARIESARLHVLGAESGLNGNTQDRIYRESDFNLGSDIASIEGNRRRIDEQTEQEAKGIAAGAASKINTLPRPSIIGTGLQIAGGFAGAYADEEKMKRQESIYKTRAGVSNEIS